AGHPARAGLPDQEATRRRLLADDVAAGQARGRGVQEFDPDHGRRQRLGGARTGAEPLSGCFKIDPGSSNGIRWPHDREMLRQTARSTRPRRGLMGRERDFSHIPVIDVSELGAGGPTARRVAEELGAACRESGFFYVVRHSVDAALQSRLRELSREFFAQDLQAKLAIRMALGGRAWRGYFRVGDELTSGKPDKKEGLYFGAELAADDPRVLAGTPLHGPNLFPAEPAGLRGAVLEYMTALTGLGHRLTAGLALSLGLEESYFAD